jgi:ATP dependent DNA ligase-like protein
VQITAPMSPGSSGSPAMDAQSGEVLGIATLIYEGGQNLNFAIPALQIAALMASASSSATVRRAELVRKTGKEVRLVSRNQVGFKHPELILLKGKGSRSKYFGALLLGAYRDGCLRYFGHSGSGFSEKGLKETIDRLKPFFTDKSPVENPPKNSRVARNSICEASAFSVPTTYAI